MPRHFFQLMNRKLNNSSNKTFFFWPQQQFPVSLQEDPSVNRLDESLNLFGQIVNNPFFREASFVLFLNKFDLFREKILYSQRHLRLYFRDYKGKLRLSRVLALLLIIQDRTGTWTGALSSSNTNSCWKTPTLGKYSIRISLLPLTPPTSKSSFKPLWRWSFPPIWDRLLYCRELRL